MQPQQRFALVTMVTLLTLGLTSLARGEASQARPNILFIMTDDHAAHALSCYGSKINQTPNLDRLAKGGMRFTNAFCTNSICGPSRAVILTGKYSHLNGFRTNQDKFDGSQPHVAKMLKTVGYQTAMIGKWHLVSNPTGFDYWNILPGQGEYNNPVMVEMGKRQKRQGYVTDIITDDAMNWVKNRDKSKPFFLMCHHKAPHRAWDPSTKYAKLYEDRDIPEPATLRDDYQTRTTAAKTTEMTVAKHMTKRDVKQDPPAGLKGDDLLKWHYQRYIKDYLRCVASVDDNIGRLLDFLDQEKIAENTLVVYTSDQGFFLGDHGWYDKRFMYEESLRSPLLVRLPGQIAAGSVNDKIVLNLDHPETFLDFAGAPIPAEMQGKSLRPLLTGQNPSDWRTTMYYRYYEFPEPHHVQPHRGVRNDRYKLIHFDQVNEWELFDLKADPHELKNIYNDPKSAEIVKTLKDELEKLRKQYKDEGPTSPVPAQPKPKTKAKG